MNPAIHVSAEQEIIIYKHLFFIWFEATKQEILKTKVIMKKK